MSDTPRTDAAKTFKVHAGCPELVSKDFARELERELTELQKDKDRLDYLLREYNIYRFGLEDRLNLTDIDEAMKGIE